jgi:hypothetical protein
MVHPPLLSILIVRHILISARCEYLVLQLRVYQANMSNLPHIPLYHQHGILMIHHLFAVNSGGPYTILITNNQPIIPCAIVRDMRYQHDPFFSLPNSSTEGVTLALVQYVVFVFHRFSAYVIKSPTSYYNSPTLYPLSCHEIAHSPKGR